MSSMALTANEACPLRSRAGEGIDRAAVERALKAAEADPGPEGSRRTAGAAPPGLIPWLAGIDPDTGAPRRRIARFSEIPPRHSR